MAKYIDAKKLKTIIKSEYENAQSQGEHYAYGVILEEIDNTPTADVVKLKHGEWTLHSNGSGTCNLCGKTQKSVWDFDNMQRYCGRCGAKMDGGEKK